MLISRNAQDKVDFVKNAIQEMAIIHGPHFTYQATDLNWNPETNDYEFYAHEHQAILKNLARQGFVRINEWLDHSNARLTFPANYVEPLEYLEYPEEEIDPTLADIYFNKETGKGYIDEHRFKLEKGSRNYNLFLKLYENMNKKVERLDVLIAIGKLYKDSLIDDSPWEEQTLQISEAVSALRRSTGLTAKQLENTDGDLILKGYNLGFEPVT